MLSVIWTPTQSLIQNYSRLHVLRPDLSFSVLWPFSPSFPHVPIREPREERLCCRHCRAKKKKHSQLRKVTSSGAPATHKPVMAHLEKWIWKMICHVGRSHSSSPLLPLLVWVKPKYQDIRSRYFYSFIHLSSYSTVVCWDTSSDILVHLISSLHSKAANTNIIFKMLFQGFLPKKKMLDEHSILQTFLQFLQLNSIKYFWSKSNFFFCFVFKKTIESGFTLVYGSSLKTSHSAGKKRCFCRLSTWRLAVRKQRKRSSYDLVRRKLSSTISEQRDAKKKRICKKQNEKVTILWQVY